MRPLTLHQRERLRTWGEEKTSGINLGVARQLLRRGLVRELIPGTGCRLASCWPLTEEGKKLRRAIREGWS